MSVELAKGDEIANLLREVCALDWIRNSFSVASFRTKEGETIEDRSTEPPYTSFRLSEENEAQIKKIDAAISSYRGRVEWTLVRRDRSPHIGINWVICPQLTIDKEAEAKKNGLTVQQYFKKFMPEFGVLAYQDMADLVLVLSNSLKGKKKGSE
ncbi:hypothetical protein [Solimonas sp. K1W22B-7]|uniref:hypothetical protein n=1 Tax=Solimonas sp. K1W22B-7 TaxID=2303331 RepID=UPI0013C4899F|nr:hypothetical protein [Solimonas sp. K1W22B-7]